MSGGSGPSNYSSFGDNENRFVECKDCQFNGGQKLGTVVVGTQLRGYADTPLYTVRKMVLLQTQTICTNKHYRGEIIQHNPGKSRVSDDTLLLNGSIRGCQYGVSTQFKKLLGKIK